MVRRPKAASTSGPGSKSTQAASGSSSTAPSPSPHDLFDVFNPATGERIARATQGSPADVDAAVAAARKAQAKWAALSGFERSKHLYALARHVQKRERFLSVLETIDNGKPIRESRDIDIPLVARHFYHHAGWASLIESEFPGTKPVGVCGQIIPWNFPLLMLAWKIAPALAAGNTVVLKPAEYTPLTALAFAAICVEAGLPAGVVNIVTGDGATGAALVAHAGVDKIAFTGSTEVGRAIRKATAGTGKKLSLELGGKSPFVVFEDADLDSAVEGAVDAIWFNQGQVCCAGSRLLVAESVAEALYAKLRARMANLRVGDPLDKSTDVGAIVAPAQLERIKRLMRRGREGGARVLSRRRFAARARLLLSADARHRSRARVGPRARGNLRSGAGRHDLPHAGRSGRARQQHPLRPRGFRLDRERQSRARGRGPHQGRRRLDQFDQHVRRRLGLRRLSRKRLRPRGRARGPARVSHRRRAEDEAELGEAGAPQRRARASSPPGRSRARSLDRTAKLYIGGKQARPDSGYSYAVLDPAGREVGLAGLGNRKDIRNAVEAAAKASSWGAATAHNRAQVLYYVAENLSARAGEFARRLRAMTGASARAAEAEVEASIRRAFVYAGFADKFDGAVHATRSRFVTLAMNEPWGVMGVVCPNEAPLLAFVSLVMPAIAMGNCVVAVPSASHPLSATDFYSILDTSDVPAGVVNIVTGEANALAKTLAEHDGVDALWYVGDAAGAAQVEALSAGNLKATWASASAVDWPTGRGP